MDRSAFVPREPIVKYSGILHAGCQIIGGLKLAIVGHVGPWVLKNLTNEIFVCFALFFESHLPTCYAYIFSPATN